eukprot:4871179-Prymnesium_polylepis.1
MGVTDCNRADALTRARARAALRAAGSVNSEYSPLRGLLCELNIMYLGFLVFVQPRSQHISTL